MYHDHDNNNDNWPKRCDGSNKTLGEMTLNEQDRIFELARKRIISRGHHEKALVTEVMANLFRKLKDAEGRRSLGNSSN